jgi:hypothetical protein
VNKIFIVEFNSTRDPTIWKRLKCVNCGWDMIAKGGMLHDAEQHLCPIGMRTVGIRDWRTIVRDAFLNGHDAEAIAIIAEMEPDRLRVNVQLRNALAEAIAQIEQHNREYKHVTADADIDRWKKIGDLK